GSQTVTIAWNDAVYQPNLAIAPDTLWFETPQQAWVDGLTFTIENTGNVPMDIFNVPLSGEIWEIQEPPVSFPYQMEVGETLELNVLITLVSPPDAYLYETFEIESMLGLSSVTVALNDVILGLDEFGTGSTEVYPNPFREQLSIEIPVETRQQIRVEVLDFQGKLITTLTDNMRQAGLHRISWNGKDRNETVVGNGIYFIRIHSAEKTELIKVMKVN
ncbi:MAG: T9SS type A sorting domain-containing protein, partial [Bacteroidota bacterium]